MEAIQKLTTLTISSTFQPSSDPVVVQEGGELKVVVPTGGCVLCMDHGMLGQREWQLTEDHTFDLENEAAGTQWIYTVLAPGQTCPLDSGLPLNAGHTIRIGSGFPE